MNVMNVALKAYNQTNQYESFAMKALDEATLEELEQVHRNAFFQIIMFEEGEGSLSVDFENYPIKAPAVVFLFPQQISALKLSPDTKGEMIMFDHTIFCSEILATELKEYNVDLHKRVNCINFSDNKGQFKEILNIRSRINKVKLPYNNLRKIEIKFLTKVIILKTIDSTVVTAFKGVKDKDLELFMEFRRLVDADFRFDRKVQNYCERLGLSAKQLNALCKKHTQRTALELIHERLSLEIKKLLIYEKTQLKELAFSLGFDSQSALNKYIGQKFGCTPSELKEQISR